MGKNRKSENGAVAVEYILVCALLVLGVVFSVPYAMDIFQYAYQVISAVVCSPFPAGL
ncbi:MAG: hypothetical protein JXR97_08550 [Planctomycetes bacterium]|nr:hypothetical protein [Planctomycetota bacterium]